MGLCKKWSYQQIWKPESLLWVRWVKLVFEKEMAIGPCLAMWVWGLAWKSLSCFQMWMSLRISTSMAIVSMDTPLTQYGRTVVLELHELPSILNIRSETLWGQSVFHLNIQEPNNQYLQMIKTAFVGSQCLAGCRSAVFGPWSSATGCWPITAGPGQSSLCVEGLQ